MFQTATAQFIVAWQADKAQQQPSKAFVIILWLHLQVCSLLQHAGSAVKGALSLQDRRTCRYAVLPNSSRPRRTAGVHGKPWGHFLAPRLPRLPRLHSQLLSSFSLSLSFSSGPGIRAVTAVMHEFGYTPTTSTRYCKILQTSKGWHVSLCCREDNRKTVEAYPNPPSLAYTRLRLCSVYFGYLCSFE